MSAVRRSKAEVLGKDELSPGVLRRKLFSEEICEIAEPGQFVHVECGKGRDFILRRPFSIHRLLPGNAFEILFQVVGRGTAALSEVRLHEFLDVIGPLGKPFDVPEGLSTALIVAGGIGIAPMIYLAEKLAIKKVRTYALQGAATQRRLFCYMDLKRLSRQVITTTEDGSAGHRGRVTDVLPDVVRQVSPEKIYACGPPDMLKRIAEFALACGIGCEVSIESQMACGVGACLSCVCRTKRGYKLTCKDGPVFEAGELLWGDVR